ncbi:M48 family metallopeptidase [bacterium]|nr:M48 family metallopeptidase [Candidatus Micrarchaeota archaeon]MBU1627815.1 M48 family metallopeptidase [bacterium]
MSTKHNIIKLADISLGVNYKDIKNVHLSVHPPTGRVTISAPLQMDLETIRLFCISKVGWIRKQQTKLKNQKRETARDYITRESHYYLGQRYLLKVIEQNAAPKIVLKHNAIELHLRNGTSIKQREEILHRWYRQQLRKLILPHIIELEKKMNVKVTEVCIRTMKTKWGTCNAKAKRIWLNTELAKKPIESIEYVLIHEMIHLLERNHNEKFMAYMDKFLPNWKHLREELNRSALGHVEWSY